MSAKSPVIVDLKFIPEESKPPLRAPFPGREVIISPTRRIRGVISPASTMRWSGNPRPDLFSRAPDL